MRLAPATRHVHGLDKSIQSKLKLGFMKIHRSIRIKEIQSRMSADVFATRPIDAKTAQYCVNDVIHLPDLHALYLRRITVDWLAVATEESARAAWPRPILQDTTLGRPRKARTVGFGN